MLCQSAKDLRIVARDGNESLRLIAVHFSSETKKLAQLKNNLYNMF
jgi:hypothetical protein